MNKILKNPAFSNIRSVSERTLMGLGHSQSEINALVKECESQMYSRVRKVTHCPRCNKQHTDSYSSLLQGYTDSRICANDRCTYVYKNYESRDTYFEFYLG